MNTEPETMTVAALGLGGNIGDAAAAMARALRELDAHGDCRLMAVSNLYRTPPWGKTDQADFFNCCALVETALSAPALLELCLNIEKGMKRVRTERWGPRTIDIDVLTFGNQSIVTESIEVPHPRMTERAFVLMPLADIAPDLQVRGKSVREWLQQADKSGIVSANEKREWWTLPPGNG
ncbi:2-amino-4-hydroxy-6-hydroxymethyldihydropteridine pyrophosphokinase [Agrobacterium pusense]|uniref:2-amino-4-hydroxy-6-hydroxymethyldihydropteridine pyrophosphokinase n=2 Tax=Rhizobiaceae TaxID=82115 RepID=A0A9W5AYC5_9HYPH|nr:2-amino-4-hydroxy-6-hydroxymethyldihydropteridine pyrophosphokinase [Agrobacterium pusense]OJH58181.1 2-amino-4-hydroxy-6-hydroxymethyldihydropteridine diphosphokinase [Agrobacterium pusense]CUW86506.1 2-amino-4-hydroxy-6-hydroxymethyldihydropteridinepyrophosphokinase (7,8-dihydro-6-hydroxymethylpterin-pyrophosphokinase) (HPPK) (6-hydroxymethyl-7,8-dihydropterin pyrophosphokinase) (PPPK) [Agrobacterium genomosp. 2 str. CFBP 5494]